ncbi:MAG: hypothetical protein OXC12_04840 [Spirochaetaceae bacterium]|nr:hypothetical protein [Spirochaetaceae bacterium]
MIGLIGHSNWMFDTGALIGLLASAVVLLGVPAILFEVYYFRIRKRRQGRTSSPRVRRL